MANETTVHSDVLKRISLVEAEVNRTNRLLTMARMEWAAQGTAYELDGKLTKLCRELEKLYAERDAAILMAAKARKLQEKVAFRPALTAAPLPITIVGAEKTSRRKRSKPRRYVDKGERKNLPNAMKAKGKADKSKGRERSKRDRKYARMVA